MDKVNVFSDITFFQSFVDELSHLTTYFTNHEKKESKTTKSIIKPVLKTSSLYKDSLSSKSPDDLLRLVIIEHLLREGHESLAVDLMHVSFSDITYRYISHLCNYLFKTLAQLGTKTKKSTTQVRK